MLSCLPAVIFMITAFYFWWIPNLTVPAATPTATPPIKTQRSTCLSLTLMKLLVHNDHKDHVTHKGHRSQQKMWRD